MSLNLNLVPTKTENIQTKRISYMRHSVKEKKNVLDSENPISTETMK